MSSTSTVSAATLALWAKSDRGHESGRWHPLLCHLLDVAASCLEIVELEPASYRRLLSEDTGLPAEEAVSVVAALVGLHDIGKANPGFQKKSADCAARVEAAGFSLLGPPDEIPHGIVSEAILIPLLKDEFNLKRGPATLLADAVGAHHGFRTQAQRRRDAGCERKQLSSNWLASQKELFHTVWDTLGAPRPWSVSEVSAAFFQRLMGLTCIADWIGSSLEFHDYDGDPKSYLAGARLRARARLKDLGWTKRDVLTTKTEFADIFQFISKDEFRFEPRPLQETVIELTRKLEEPILLLVEAPMGEGKTEASFYGHVALQQQLGHRGAYVGLPSQATGNAMFERLRDFLAGQGREEPPDLQLLHGAAILSQSYRELQNFKPNTPDDPQHTAVVARSYFTHLKRGMLSEYGAGTVDQALLSVLPVKHHFVRLWGLGNRTVILDEVHAYDAYTGELLNELIAWLRALGSSVILMSATLPDSTRGAMLKAFGAEQSQDPAPYPRVTRVHRGKVSSHTFQARPLISFSLQPAPLDLTALARTALKTVEDGGCLACIVNTVDRAQKLFSEIQALDPEIDLHLFHARFPICQKQKIEETVLALYGKGLTNTTNPVRPKRSVLVATQVVEQSLDLDFDVMLTDLAPVDLVLQRAGRLHRHDKNNGSRGPHEKATLLVSGLESSNITQDWLPTYWHKIYSPDILVRSWLVMQREFIDLNKDLDPLVQSVYNYNEELPGQKNFEAYLERPEEDRIAEQSADSRDAKLAALGWPTGKGWKERPARFLPDNDDGIDLVTRKAEPTVVLVPAHRISGELYLDEKGTERVTLTQNPKQQIAAKIYERTVKISRVGVVRHLEKHGQTPWTNSGLLRRVVLLPMENGSCEVGGTRLILCPKLGLIYEKLEKNER